MKLKAITLGAAFAAITACQTTSQIDGKDEVIEAATPKSMAVRNVSNFSDAVACMDLMLLNSGANGAAKIVLAAEAIPDATGRVGGGTKEILISTLSSMATRSDAIDFVDFSVENSTILDLAQQNSGQRGVFDIQVPDFFIRGAITQADKSAVQSQMGGNADFTDGSGGLSSNDSSDLITLDLNLGRVRDLKIVNGVNSRNTIAVNKSGTAAEAGGLIENSGMIFSVNMGKSEGKHQAVRTLMELGLVELVGKLANIPYWKCLNLTSVDTIARANAVTDYYKMSQKEVHRYFSERMTGRQTYKGPVVEELTQELQQAIATYEAQAGLIADGRPDETLYLNLLMFDDLVANGWDPASFKTQYGNSKAVAEIRIRVQKMNARKAAIQAAQQQQQNNTPEPAPQNTQAASVENTQQIDEEKMGNITLQVAQKIANVALNDDEIITLKKIMQFKGFNNITMDSSVDAFFISSFEEYQKEEGYRVDGMISHDIYGDILKREGSILTQVLQTTTPSATIGSNLLQFDAGNNPSDAEPTLKMPIITEPEEKSRFN